MAKYILCNFASWFKYKKYYDEFIWKKRKY